MFFGHILFFFFFTFGHEFIDLIALDDLIFSIYKELHCVLLSLTIEVVLLFLSIGAYISVAGHICYNKVQIDSIESFLVPVLDVALFDTVVCGFNQWLLWNGSSSCSGKV